MCADHCIGCELHKNTERKPIMLPHIPNKTKRKVQSTSRDYNTQDDIERAIELSLSNSSSQEEHEILEKALAASLMEHEKSTKNKVETIKAILPEIPQYKILEVLKECHGNEESTLEVLLTLPTEFTFEELDECVICLESTECYFVSCGCCKMCRFCFSNTMKEKCPICNKKTNMKQS